MEYISKDAVENILRGLWKEDDGNNSEHRICWICYNKALQGVQCQIDTLEVKEVDLEKELKEDWLFADKTEVDCLESMCLTEDMFVSLAKKYFELGLKVAQKGE